MPCWQEWSRVNLKVMLLTRGAVKDPRILLAVDSLLSCRGLSESHKSLVIEIRRPLGIASKKRGERILQACAYYRRATKQAAFHTSMGEDQP